MTDHSKGERVSVGVNRALRIIEGACENSREGTLAVIEQCASAYGKRESEREHKRRKRLREANKRRVSQVRADVDKDRQCGIIITCTPFPPLSSPVPFSSSLLLLYLLLSNVSGICDSILYLIKYLFGKFIPSLIG